MKPVARLMRIKIRRGDSGESIIGSLLKRWNKGHPLRRVDQPRTYSPGLLRASNVATLLKRSRTGEVDDAKARPVMQAAGLSILGGHDTDAGKVYSAGGGHTRSPVSAL
jgi:hypothetical protein